MTLSSSIIESLSPIDEAIAISWKGGNSGGRKWINTVKKSFPEILGGFIREGSATIDGIKCTVLVFDKGAFVIKPDRNGFSKVTHFGFSDFVGTSRLKWQTKNNMIVSGTHVLTAIPDTIRSVKDVLNVRSARVTSVPEKTLPAVDVNKVASELKREIKRGMSYSFNGDLRLEVNGDSAEIEVRHWGKWYSTNDADGDDDWEELTDESGKKFDAMIDRYRSNYPTLSFDWQTGEKNWIYVDISTK